MSQHPYKAAPLPKRIALLKKNWPAQLRDYNCYLLFKLKPGTKEGKWEKLPFYATTLTKRRGEQGSAEDVANMVTFDQALATLQKHADQFDGIGFAPRADVPFGLVDLDKLDKHPELNSLISLTYSEHSVSKTGARLVFAGKLGSNTKNTAKGIELFDSKGFVTITGARLNGAAVQRFDGEARDSVFLHVGAGATPTNGERNPQTDAYADQYPDQAGLRAANIDDVRWLLQNTPNGKGRDRWVAMAHAVKAATRSLDHDEALEIWLDWCSQYDGGKGEAEAKRVWRSAGRGHGGRFKAGIGWLVKRCPARDAEQWQGLAETYSDWSTAADDFDVVGKADQWRDKKKPRNNAPAVQARTYDLGSVADTNGYEPRVFINDMLAEGCCLLVGPMKMGKTFMAMQIAAMLNTGKPLWDNDIEKPVKVALLALEEGGQAEDAENDPVHRMRKRVRDMKLVEDLRGVNLVLHLEPREDGGVGHVRELFAEHDVLIIDSLAKIEQINDAEEGGIWKADYAIIEKFRKVATELHKCLVIITHTAKDSNQRDAMAAIAGTGGKLAAADGMWILQRPDKDDPDRIRLTTYGRDVSSDDYEMRWVGDQRWWHCLGPWVNLTPQQQDVLNWLIESGNDWSTREALAEGLGANRDTSALWFLINKLVGKKLVNQRVLPGHENGAGRPPMQYRASSVAIRRDRLLRALETAHVARVNVVDPFEV